MMKGKVKEFFKDNKEMIFLTMLIGAGCGALHNVGRKSGAKHVFDNYCAINKNTELYRTLRSVVDTYNDHYAELHLRASRGIEPEELGEVGKAILDWAEKNHEKVGKFTHFIAFGSDEK